MGLRDSIVFQEQEDGSWAVFDHGPGLVMYARYRVGAQPKPLFMIEFEEGWPVSGRRRG